MKPLTLWLQDCLLSAQCAGNEGINQKIVREQVNQSCSRDDRFSQMAF